MRDQRVFLWVLSLPVCFWCLHLAIVYPVVFAWSQSVAFCTDLAESFLLGTIAKLNEGAYIMEVNMISVCCVSSSV